MPSPPEGSEGSGDKDKDKVKGSGSSQDKDQQGQDEEKEKDLFLDPVLACAGMPLEGDADATNILTPLDYT